MFHHLSCIDGCTQLFHQIRMSRIKTIRADIVAKSSSLICCWLILGFCFLLRRSLVPPLLLSTSNTFSDLSHSPCCPLSWLLHTSGLLAHLLQKLWHALFALILLLLFCFLLCLTPPPPASAEEPCVQEDPPSSDLPHLLHHTSQFRGVDGHHAHLLLWMRGSAMGHRAAGYALCGVRGQSAWEMPRAAERWLSAEWVTFFNYRKTETQKRWTTKKNTYLNVPADFCMKFQSKTMPQECDEGQHQKTWGICKIKCS